ncbi:hypothetical protein PybrP1_010743 [[Pythium] brassicae (nom. inval.)]|nr:hypothetical protein PybrP1_010743 [[Pythium] brassicae (nom. inval.)]
MGRPAKLKAPKVKAAAAAAATPAAPATPLLDDWVVTLREVMQDVQALALERTTHTSTAVETSGGGASVLHEASLAPAVRRLRRVFYADVGVGRALAEERWLLFRDELWLAAARVLAAPRVPAAVVHAFGAFFGAFLCGETNSSSSSNSGSAGGSPESSASKTRREQQQRSLHELRGEFLQRLLDATGAEDKNVRLRVCHFLQILLNKWDAIDADLVPKLRAALIPRANDKLGSVRVQSVYALKRIQEPDDAKDPVTAELLRLMATDPSKDVRKAAVLSVAVTPAAYKELLFRLRDVSDDVRHAAFQVLGERLSVRDLPISDRAHVLDQGLQDRSERVRRACEELVLAQWLPTCRGSPVALLKALDIEQFPAIGARVSRVVLRHVSANPRLEDAVPHNALEILAANSEACDAESIFFWREQCLYYQSVDRDLDKAAALLPNLSDFCKLVVVACEAGSEMLFIAQQLLALGHLLDFQDEFGRRKLLDCLQKMLRNVETETGLIPSIMELMACIHAGSSDQEFIQERDAAAHRFEELEQLLESLDMDSAEYADVQSEMLELEKLLQDPAVLRRLRCLEVVAQLLKLTASTLRDPIIAGMGRYILPAIESDVPAVREAGMEGLGLLCLLDKAFAEKHMLVFWRALSNEDEERDVKHNCIKALFDMLFSFANLSPKSMVPLKAEAEASSSPAAPATGGNEADEADDAAAAEPTEPSVRVDTLDLDTVLLGLAELLVVDELDVQSTIVEGFCKLFLLNRIANVAVLAQLLETFFSPALQRVELSSEHGYHSRALQLLSVFFSAFARAAPANCALLEEATVHLLQKLLEAPDFGGARAADAVAVVKYVGHLLRHAEAPPAAPTTKTTTTATKSSTSDSQAACAHNNRLGLNLCMEILALERVATATTVAKVDEEQVVSRQKALVKALLLLEVAASEPRSAALFLALLRDVAATSFPAQRGLVRSAEALSKRSAASYREQGGAAADADVLAQDHAWAEQHVAARTEALGSALAEATRLEATRRKQKQRLAKQKRRAGRRSSSEESASSSDEDDDEDDDDDDGDDDSDAGAKAKPAVPLPRREVSARKSKAVATARMANRDFDVKMKIAFESDEEEGDEGDGDDDEDDESDEEEDDDESSAEE